MSGDAGAVLLLALGGLLARLYVFDDVGVNGDSGLYLYDAKQLLWGSQMFIEFPSRSPVFEHLLAAVVWLGDSPFVAGRTLMVVVGVVLGVCIYLLARRIHSHAAGLVASGLFYFMPFTVVWGVWIKTEQAAAILVITAFLVVLRYIDRDRIPVPPLMAVGVLFALAFLVRRVVIVHVGALALFALWYRYRNHGQFTPTLVYGAVIGGAAIATLMVGYWLLAWGDIGTALAIADQHALALFKSDGQGSLGWVPVERASAVTAESRPGLFAQLCQKCGLNTVEIFMRTGFVAFPTVLLFVAFLRSAYARYGWVGSTLLPVAIVIPSMLAIWTVLGSAHVSRLWAGGLMLLAVLYLWAFDPPPLDDIWRPTMLLPVLVLFALAAGYLHRDRILYVTYFQDLFPYLAVVTGATGAAYFRRLWPERKRLVAVGLAILLVATVPATMNAYPYQPRTPDDGDNDWFTPELVHAYGDDIEDRTAPGGRVFTAQPLYIIEADRKLAVNLSRKYYAFHGWPHSPVTQRVAARLVDQLSSGRVPWAVYGRELDCVLRTNQRVNATFHANYEPVTDQPAIYGAMNATLYRYTENGTVPDAPATVPTNVTPDERCG